MTWLVTGGAGYVGAHVVSELIASGRAVAVLDDLSTGVGRKVPHGAVLVRGDVADAPLLREVMGDHRITGVVHLAAKKAVAESVADPLLYYRENVGGLLGVASAMRDAGVRRLVYSSSAAVYGSPDVDRVTEQTPTVPMSPYGETKLAGEWLVRAVAKAEGLSAVALRYFNVAGAATPELGDTGAHNLVPLIMRAVSQGLRPQVFGDDYPTPDGTCVRDYIHVVDVAAAHVAAARFTEAEGSGFRVFNLGRGVGASVLEVIASVGRAAGATLEPTIGGRRAGDPARLVADPSLAQRELGWVATRDLDEMTRSAWEAWQAGPGPRSGGGGRPPAG